MIKALICAIFASTSFAAFASCTNDGKSSQSVTLSVAGKQLDRWEPIAGQIHRVVLPAGFELGLQIEPATAEKYRELLKRVRSVDELVKITLLDGKDSAAKALSVTWGGTNSRQGFGPRGGANRVVEMGDQVDLWLHKPVCITLESVASMDQ